MKIIHLPTLVGNHGYSMAHTERLLGYDSIAIALEPNKFNMKTDINLNLPSGFSKLPRLLYFFLANRKKYDIYHFNFARTLLDFPGYGLDFLDLPYYKGKKMVTFNGSDCRLQVTRELNPFSPYLGGDSKGDHYLDYKRKMERVEKLSPHIDTFFALNPDLLNFLPEEQSVFLPYIKKSWFDVRKCNFSKLSKKDTLRIVHAPTNRSIKGTDEIISAIEDLKSMYNIDFILIENMTHDQALELYKSAHLVIDQIKLGWYGGFALEVMRMGIPVAVYINELDLKFLDCEMADSLLESVININPISIKEKLSQIFDNPEQLNSLAEKSYNYATKFHNPLRVIPKVIERYKN